ncbi:MAG: putative membrane protein [Idiomarinaceae bacterium HL-53]|nr:MAG: putative membrane protein [Idiomarinaceae bacterium HL-53]CUS48977.1 hypothetical protein Ga0003345_1958 [Idiomarinaceae bacterium HL-53]
MIKRVGGSPEAAMNNNFKLDSNLILKEAWDLTRKNFLTMLGAVVIMLLISMIVDSSLQDYFGVVIEMGANGEPIINVPGGYIASFMVFWFVVMAPLQAALTKMGIRNATAEEAEDPTPYKNKPWMVFNYSKTPWKVSFVEFGRLFLPMFTVGFLAAFGLGLIGLLVGLFLAITLQLSTALVVQDGLSTFKAFKVSVQVITKKFFPFLTIGFVMFVLFILGFITFGIGLLWVIPMHYNLIGVLYKHIFGVEVEVNSDDEPLDIDVSEV